MGGSVDNPAPKREWAEPDQSKRPRSVHWSYAPCPIKALSRLHAHRGKNPVELQNLDNTIVKRDMVRFWGPRDMAFVECLGVS